LRDVAHQFKSRGVNIVVIGNGTVEQARAFHSSQPLPFPLYTDPSLRSYRAAEFHRGVGGVLKPKVVLHAMKAMSQGFRQTKTLGDPMQNGGVLLIGKGGQLRYRYASQEAGDHPDLTPLLSPPQSERSESSASKTSESSASKTSE